MKGEILYGHRWGGIWYRSTWEVQEPAGGKRENRGKELFLKVQARQGSRSSRTRIDCDEQFQGF
jgi:hypothetical protein